MILSLVGILIVAGYVLILHVRLDEPVFLNHYYDLEIYEDGEYLNDMPLSLNYITNVDDDRVVNHIEFPEFPELFVHVSEYGFEETGLFNMGQSQNDIPGHTYGQYSIREVFIHFQNISDVEELNDEIITQAQIYFDDSSSLMVDIGEVHLFNRTDDETPLENLQGSSSSDGTGETLYRATEDITLSSMDRSLLENVEERVDIQVNNMDYTDAEGLFVQEEDSVNITTLVQPSEELSVEYTIFDIHPAFILSAEDGTDYSQRIHSINNPQPEFSFLNLYRYLKTREEM